MAEDRSTLERHILRKEIEELKKRKGRGTELISLYIPPDKNLDDVVSHMRSEFSQASNIKSKRTRKNVTSGIETIIQRIRMIGKMPENGVAIFTGFVGEGANEKQEVHILSPPEKITTYIYRCDSEFYLKPLEEMLEEKSAYGLLVLDRREATYGLLKGKVLETKLKITSNVPGKTTKGGQSQQRYARLREIAAHEFFVRIAKHAEEIFLNIPDLKGIIIGGPGPTKDYFIKEEYLHHELRKKIIGVVDTSYTDEFGLRELVEKADSIVEGLEINREKKLVQRFLAEVVKKEPLAAYGEKEVMHYLEAGAVDTLLISEKSIAANNEKKLEKIKELAEEKGTKVELISADTEEGKQLLAFSGIAAILRYRL